MDKYELYERANNKKWEYHNETDKRDELIKGGADRKLSSDEYANIVELMNKYKKENKEFKQEYIKVLLDYIDVEKNRQDMLDKFRKAREENQDKENYEEFRI